MGAPFRLACLQTNAQREVAPNLVQIRELALAARGAGADFIATPECAALLEPKRRLLLEKVEPESANTALTAFSELAAETGAWFLVGSIPVKLAGGKIANRGYLLDTSGRVTATYDKIHMFDVELGGGESYRESATYEAGGDAVLAATPWGVLGLTICYDLRFPALYRSLAQGGADFLSVPSAFTRVTGRAHWHVLLRARAMETGCFVLAPAQCGTHAEGRETYGHSLIVDPWGEVLADGGEDVGFVTARIEPERAARARRGIPSLTHGQAFTMPAAAPKTAR